MPQLNVFALVCSAPSYMCQGQRLTIFSSMSIKLKKQLNVIVDLHLLSNIVRPDYGARQGTARAERSAVRTLSQAGGIVHSQ